MRTSEFHLTQYHDDIQDQIDMFRDHCFPCHWFVKRSWIFLRLVRGVHAFLSRMTFYSMLFLLSFLDSCFAIRPTICEFSPNTDKCHPQLIVRPATGRQHRGCIISQAVTHRLSAPEDGQNNSPKYVKLIGVINKPLLLHLVGFLYYLYFTIFF